jgi:hypothetical protein
VNWLISLAAAGQTLAPLSPGDDFDAFANSPWIEAAEIPAGRSRWTARDELAALTQRQIAMLLEAAKTRRREAWRARCGTSVPPNPTRPRSNAGTRAPAAGAGPHRCGARQGRALPAARCGMLADADPMNVGTTSRRIGWAWRWARQPRREVQRRVPGAGGLGLGSREPYLADDATRRDDYQRYLAACWSSPVFARCGTSGRGAAVRDRARAHACHGRGLGRGSQRRQSLDARRFRARSAGHGLGTVLRGAGLGTQPAFVAWQPTAIRGGAALVDSQPLSTWLDYLRLRTLDDHADVLPRVFQESFAALHGTRDADLARGPMAGLIGQLYGERYFPAAQKARVNDIVRNVSAAFRRRVETVSCSRRRAGRRR